LFEDLALNQVSNYIAYIHSR